MNRRTRALAIWAAVALALFAVIVVRHQPAPSPEDLYGSEYGYLEEEETVTPVAADTTPPTTPDTTTAPTTTAAPVAPTEEPNPGPATITAPSENDVVAATAVTFLRGWVLRGTWEQRSDALKSVTATAYLPQIAFIDPDRIGLPPGTAVTADPAQATISEAGAATVPATVDGLPVIVHEVRTAAGWRVTAHGKG